MSNQRLSVSLSSVAAETLDLLAEHQGITKNNALIKALATERYIWESQRTGGKILIQEADGKIREVIFR